MISVVLLHVLGCKQAAYRRAYKLLHRRRHHPLRPGFECVRHAWLYRYVRDSKYTRRHEVSIE